jgi:hypothetical protein
LVGCAAGALTTGAVRAAVARHALRWSYIEALADEVALWELVLKYFGGALSARITKITEKDNAIRTINDSITPKRLSAGSATVTTAVTAIATFRDLSHVITLVLV